MKTREIEIPDRCWDCRFKVGTQTFEGCCLYKKDIIIDVFKGKPQWCNATSVTINERDSDEDKRD